MTWFKENKFLGGLIAITILLAGLLLAFGISQKGKKEELLAEIEQTKLDLTKKRKMDPFPNPENVRQKKENLKELIASATELQESLLAYAPAAIDDIPVAEFSSRFEKTEKAIRELYGEKIFLDEDFHMGFERYKVETPNSKATGILNYQLEAFDWLFRELAAAGISEVSNFVRAELPPERGEDWGGAKPSKPARGKNRARKPALPQVGKKLPFELTFRGKEAAVRDVLSRIANGEKYFILTRALAVKNPGNIPSNRKLEIGSLEEEASDESDDDGSIFDNEEPVEDVKTDSEEVASPSGERSLERVAGGEDLSVMIRADLMLFEKSAQFPEVK